MGTRALTLPRPIAACRDDSRRRARPTVADRSPRTHNLRICALSARSRGWHGRCNSWTRPKRRARDSRGLEPQGV